MIPAKRILNNRKHISDCLMLWLGRRLFAKGMRELPGMKEMIYILIVIMITLLKLIELNRHLR